MTVQEAREKRVCRICGESLFVGGTPKDAPLEFGRMTYPIKVTFNFGEEYAHTDCLETEEKLDDS